MTEDPSKDPAKQLQNREYAYSRAGDILQITDNVKGIVYDYTYDKLHRLVAESLSGSGAPAATTVETITLAYEGTGPVHGVKTIDLNGVSRTCSYDANGNMVVSPDFSNETNPLDRSITYDADNMPVQISHANGTTVNFVYDSVAKRTKKLVQGGKTVLYLGDHYEVENNVAIKYIFGGNLRLAQIKGSLTSYFHKDHLGSTAAVTDEAGLKIESTTYEPFGATRDHTGDNTSAYKFTDQELDNETNLYNYDARLYDSVLGMFVTPDSIVPGMYDPQMLNRYAYCRNNPLIYVDPSGHGLGQAWPGGPEEGIGGKGHIVDPDTKPKDVDSWEKVFKHADKWLKREKTAFGRWLNWGEELRTINELIKFEIKSFFVNILDYMHKNNIKCSAMGFSSSYKYASFGWMSDDPVITSITIGKVGTGASFDVKIFGGFAGFIKEAINWSPASGSIIVGLGKNLGATIDPDGTVTLNLGYTIEPTPKVTPVGTISVNWAKVQEFLSTSPPHCVGKGYYSGVDNYYDPDNTEFKYF